MLGYGQIRKQYQLLLMMTTVLRYSEINHDDTVLKFEFQCIFYMYSSPNIVRVIKSRRLRWAGHLARMGEGRGVYRVLIGKPESKRPLGRPRYRLEDNSKLDHREIGINGANWILLSQDRVHWQAFVNMIMNLRVP
jgi:hypothetical protein